LASARFDPPSMPTHMARNVGIALACALLGTALWVVLRGRSAAGQAARGSYDVPSISQRSAPSVARIAAVERTQARAFAVFRRAPTIPSPAMKRAIRTTLGPTWSELGLNLRLARRVRAANGAVAWVIPGRGFVCIAANVTGASGCNTTRETIEHGMTMVVGQQMRGVVVYYALGLAPNGVRRAIVSVGARRALVPIEHNVYAYRASSPIKATLAR
jgi:hypothetical protein